MQTPTPTILDVRPLPPKERHALILGTFDALAPGEAFVLVNDHDPKPLLYVFQNERAGRFDWSPLEQGPDTWRVMLSRTDRSYEVSPVSDYLAWDHDRLDSRLGAATDALAAGDAGSARTAFGEFLTGLRRHIRMEEQVLFPAFERATGMPEEGGPTGVMRAEHREIESILDRMTECVQDPQVKFPEFDGLRRSLLAVLGDHNEKEEHVVYPLTDQGLHAPGQREELIRRMQSV